MKPWSKFTNLIVEKLLVCRDGFVFGCGADKGIKVDPNSPAFCWRDLEGEIVPKTTGTGSPTLAAYRGGNVREFAFGAGDDYDCRFHIPHDYVQGSAMYMHLHWSHNGTAISGDLVVNWYITYSKGHRQAEFSAEINATQTISVANVTALPRYRHAIDEFQLSASSPSASQLDSDLIEPDGLMLVHMDVTAIPTISGGTQSKPFIHYVDLHYQSTGIGTKQKAPNFYAA